MKDELFSSSEITSDDRVFAALSWIPVSPLWPIFAIVVLLLDDKKDRPFIRYNAILSLATGVILIPLSIVTLGCAAFLYFVFFYWAYLAYQGQRVEIPVVTDFAKNQGWI